MGYSWGIRGIFTGYSWDIRMYRVCVGYVSGMCRECVERNGVRVGSSNFMQDNLHNEYIINNLNNIDFSTTCYAQNNTLRATREMGKRQWRQCCAQINTPWALRGRWPIDEFACNPKKYQFFRKMYHTLLIARICARKFAYSILFY